MATAPASLRAWWRRYVLALGLALVVIATGIGAANVMVDQKLSAIHRVGNMRLSNSGHPARAGNYLVLGSDSRAFVDTTQQAQQFGSAAQQSGQRSDTMMIVHVEPKSGQSLLVSIPRDLWVQVPGHGMGKINSAFDYGKTPAEQVQSVIDTIKLNFNVSIDHFLLVDFVTFQGIVDAIGRVSVYFPSRARDTFTGLDVPAAGCFSMNGAQALAYVRSRHLQYFVDGHWQDADGLADIGRINRQQNFIRHLADVAVKASLRNPLTANAVADRVVSKLTVDAALGKGDIFSLVNAFRRVDPNNANALQMITLPWVNGPMQQGQAVLNLKQPDADQVLAQLRQFGTPIGSSSAPSSVKPAQVKVRVLNGTGVSGQAASTVNALEQAGFPGAGTGNGTHTALTSIHYLPGMLDKAKLVQSYLGVGQLVADRSIVDADVVVLLGRDFQRVTVPSATASPTAVVSGAKSGTSTPAKPAAPAC
ncbi:MAG: LCP family protein [Actinobacteria bacterium]|nr:LCP family protein [Actinomycetota bacterium]